MKTILKAAALAVFAAGAAAAQSPAPTAPAADIEIELNKLEQMNGSCRFYLVFRTRGGEALDRATIDFFLFDQEEVILKQFAYEAGPLASSRTAVKRFDLPETACVGVGKLLLNNVTNCEAADGPRENCIDRFAPSSRAEAALIK